MSGLAIGAGVVFVVVILPALLIFAFGGEVTGGTDR